MFESERIAALAEHQRINTACLSRVLRLTMLASDIVEAIPDKRPPEGTTLSAPIKLIPVES